MKDLIERLEKATGPDAEIDYAIGEWLYMQGRQPWECFNYGKDGPAIKFTASIDAALTLVPPRWRVNWCGQTPSDDWFFELIAKDTNQDSGRHWHPVGAIALCIAALKARGEPQ